MNRKRFTASLLSLGLAAALALPAFAQDSTPEATPLTASTTALASGLNDPRGIAYDTDGSLYIAEAGAGGAVVLMHSDQGDATAGFTSQVTMVGANGKQSVALGGLASYSSPTGDIVGLERVYPKGNSLWLVVSGGQPGQAPPFYGDAVEEVDKASGRIKTYIDLYAFEKANNPDGGDIDSNANDLTWGPDGVLYIVDTAGNDLLSWTPADGLKVVEAWKDDPVPTSARFGSKGDLYVGFLGQGIAPGAGKVEHWSGGKLVETFSNLNAVTDIEIGRDGGLYVVQLAQFGQQGPIPNSGSVVEVSQNGVKTVAAGLNAPFTLAQAADGSWAVSVNATFAPPGSGAVIKISGL